MMLRKIGMAGWLALGVAFLLSYGYAEAAQPDASKPVETAMIKLKYRSAADVKPLLQSLLEGMWLKMEGERRFWIDERSNTIFIKAPREKIELAQQMVKQIDVLPRQMHIEIKLIRASRTGKTISPEIKGLISKLQSLFAFSSYELLDSISLIAESGAKTSLSTGGKYRVTCTPRFIDEGKGIIRLEDLKLIKLYQMSQSDTSATASPFFSLKGNDEEGSLSINIPNLFAVALLDKLSKGEDVDFGEPILTTSLNVKNGDTVIVGGSKIDGNETALITVVTAKTIE